MKTQYAVSEEPEMLDFFDLLLDDNQDELNDYVSIKVSNHGNQTKISVKTIEEVPSIYTTTVNGVNAQDLKSILGGRSLDEPLGDFMKAIGTSSHKVANGFQFGAN